MAKGRTEEPSQAAAGTPGTNATPAMPATGKKAGKKAARREARAKKGLRKHMRNLERQLTAATRLEARRLRKLEKARWRRQRIQAALDGAQTAVDPAKGGSPKARSAKAASGPGPGRGKRAKEKSEEKTSSTGDAEGDNGSAPGSGAAPGSSAAGAQAIDAYCLRERKHVQMVDPKAVVTARGGSALSGTCPSCGAALFKLVGRGAS